MRSRDGVRRPSSSAETSIDENTADQLFVDDFIVPASPITSRAGTMTFARPTSSAFDSQRRTPSLASSQAATRPPPPSTVFHSNQPSTATAVEPDPVPPSFALLSAPSGVHFIRPHSAEDSVISSCGNPFIDPIERGGVSSIAEKHQSAWPLETSEPPTKGKRSTRKILIIVILSLLLLLAAILIPVGIVVIKSESSKMTANSDSDSSDGLIPPDTHDPAALGIPPSAVGTVLDSTKWLDWTDFNVTYTNATVGGLSLMGLNSTWNDSVQVNSNVPKLSQPFPYGTQPIKGINIGGWLVLEPYITPSLFSSYPISLGIVDEYTLSQYLGRDNASAELEKHYATFIRRQSFQDIRDAGFDHVRVPFPYWIIENVHPNDPYVEKIGWRYFLRAIEWAREVGLRINICLHAAPGSQNGWNHSGRQGAIGWLNGTDGEQNAQLTTNFLKQLGTFFSQPRYVNVVTMFSILNEPNMILLGSAPVNEWSKEAYAAVRESGFTGSIIISDGFLPPADFIGQFSQATYPGLTIDMHNYVIFNSGNLAETHQSKIGFACVAWSGEIDDNVDPSKGFGGPTIVGEWSIADTDCALYVNAVGQGYLQEVVGKEPILETQELSLAALDARRAWDVLALSQTRTAPTTAILINNFCQIFILRRQLALNFLGDGFIGDSAMYSLSDRRTWDTENATQWSYKKLLAAGIVNLQQTPDNFNCNSPTPDYQALGLPETI